MTTVKTMDHMTKEILAVVQSYRNDEAVIGMKIPFDMTQEMYAYGSDSEFGKMLEDLKKKFDVYLVRVNGSGTLQQFVESVKLWMEVSAYVHEVIQHQRTDDVMVIGRSPIRQDEIMYNYGASEEFESIINELEDHFGIVIDSDDIGEERVHEFVNHIYCLVKKKQEAENELKKHDWEPTDSQGYSMECSKCGLAISIHQAESWNANLEADCPRTTMG